MTILHIQRHKAIVTETYIYIPQQSTDVFAFTEKKMNVSEGGTRNIKSLVQRIHLCIL